MIVFDSVFQISITSGAFLCLKLPDDSLLYSRRRTFVFNEAGQIVTLEDYPLEPNAGTVPANIGKPIRISVTGVVEVFESPAWVVAGQIMATLFEHPELLTNMGNGYFAESVGSGPAQTDFPGSGGDFTTVQTFYFNSYNQINQTKTMSRINIPITYSDERELLINVDKQNTLTPIKLASYLTEQSIDLSDLLAKGLLADVQDSLSKSLKRDAEKLTKKVDLLLKIPVMHLRGAIQNLKTVVRPEYRKLGDWGVTVDNISKVVYPSTVGGWYDLLENFIAKRDTYPVGTSPVQAYLDNNNVDLDADLVILGNAKTAQADQQKAMRDSETATTQRNVLWDPIVEHLHGIGSYLVTLDLENPQLAGDYGYNIDHSKQKPKKRTSKCPIEGSITVQAIVFDSLFVNLMDFPVHVFPGRLITDTPIVVPAHGTLAMKKGFSRITVYNPSATVVAKFTTMFHP